VAFTIERNLVAMGGDFHFSSRGRRLQTALNIDSGYDSTTALVPHHALFRRKQSGATAAF
jgi:hypothetical protein